MPRSGFSGKRTLSNNIHDVIGAVECVRVRAAAQFSIWPSGFTCKGEFMHAAGKALLSVLRVGNDEQFCYNSGAKCALCRTCAVVRACAQPQCDGASASMQHKQSLAIRLSAHSQHQGLSRDWACMVQHMLLQNNMPYPLCWNPPTST